jgi:hypothetical protein
MTVQPIASPSRPSVRFTAFDDPTITTQTKMRKGTKASGHQCGELIKE